MSRKEIFVFGSNLAGVHGAGAALHARKNHGAVIGRGIGLQGSSYAIPTKDERIKALPLHEIQSHVGTFIVFAASHPELTFLMTRIGCGLAGYSDKDIAPMFAKVTSNVSLPPEWVDFLRRTGAAS